MIRRPPRSTPLYSSAASDVYKRQAVMLHEKEKLWRQVEHLNGKKALPQRPVKPKTAVAIKPEPDGSVEVKKYEKVLEKMAARLEEKENEIKKLSKENYSLINRVRNQAKPSK
eukprot:TRINITY_DN3604_c0_g1_i13.p3 TRINITY_DN3604_c0_g1~~TRINITY_DN3604_c0_g1_i13.p3  ORF type:complete len:122 (+),score=42.36 TRINITY_DN3604_c0_g1_i13:29-367(+)